MPLESRKKEVKKAEGNNKTWTIAAVVGIIFLTIYAFSGFFQIIFS